MVADENCKIALDKIKAAIREEVILRFPNFSKPFVISSDASTSGIGAALQQRDENGHLRPIGFASRSLNQAERRYPAVELEALSIVYGLQQFRAIILGYPIELTTDHKPLVYLLKHTNPNNRLYSYQLALLDYQITNISYLEGVNNHVPDYLSRWSLKPDQDYMPSLVFNVNHSLIGASSPNYSYKKSDNIVNLPNSLITFSDNARNIDSSTLPSDIDIDKERLKQLFKNKSSHQ